MVERSECETKKSSGELDFSSLILGFSSAALYHIGYESADDKSSSAQNFALARQNIEIIRMLRQKTKGNLTADEKRLVAEVIEDLDQKYDHAQKKK